MASAPMAATATWQAPRLTKIVAEAKRQAALHNVMYATGGGHGARPAPLGSRVDCSGFIREMYGWAFGVDIGNGDGDSIVRTSVTVIGWAFDPSAAKSSNAVSIIVDGNLVVRTPANAARADVNRPFHLTGQHGLHKRIALAPGKHKLCAMALPTPSKATQQLLGCKDVIVTS